MGKNEVYNEGEDEGEPEDEDEEAGAGPQKNYRHVWMNATIRAGLVKAVAIVIVVFTEVVRLRST